MSASSPSWRLAYWFGDWFLMLHQFGWFMSCRFCLCLNFSSSLLTYSIDCWGIVGTSRQAKPTDSFHYFWASSLIGYFPCASGLNHTCGQIATTQAKVASLVWLERTGAKCQGHLSGRLRQEGQFFGSLCSDYFKAFACSWEHCQRGSLESYFDLTNLDS